MRLIHITDPHLTSLDTWSLTRLRGKRWQGYLSWQRNRQWQHRADMLSRLMAAVRAENAAHWLLTGDLAQIGLPDEIAAAADCTLTHMRTGLNRGQPIRCCGNAMAWPLSG
jgi:3',5'-cyclic AMP phosphodiesterase CpdA